MSFVSFKLAGFWTRLVAQFIDGVLLLIMCMILELTHLFLNGTIIALSLLLSGVYFVYWESSYKQATPGKMVVGIRVVNVEGLRISPLQAAGRFVGKLLSGIFFGIGFLAVAFSPNKRSLHDFLADTYVIGKQLPYPDGASISFFSRYPQQESHPARWSMDRLEEKSSAR